MKRIIFSGLSAVALTGALVAVPGTAHAAGCVSKAEYRAVKKGWPESRVHTKFGTSGKRSAIASSGGYASEVRTYNGCGSAYNVVAVSYDREPGDVFRLSAKSAVWVN